mmetsp:Transcript_86715/g.250444  ORF Transcript_86715/g.250444 Transcript_86715/m.250444 type:complete len:269 (+) Transcript_86715:452-1258(+)
MSHKETWPSSWDVANCALWWLMLKLVTALATGQLQTQLAAAVSHTRTPQSHDPLINVNGNRDDVPNIKLVTTWLWPLSTILGSSDSAPPPAAFLLDAPSASPSTAPKRDGPAFHTRMSWSQPAPATKSAFSSRATVCKPWKCSDDRTVLTGPTAGLAPCRMRMALAPPSLPAAATRLSSATPPAGRACKAVMDTSANLEVSLGAPSSYTRREPSKELTANHRDGNGPSATMEEIQSGTSSTWSSSGSLNARTYSKRSTFSELSFRASK